jgi:hypothetical protein
MNLYVALFLAIQTTATVGHGLDWVSDGAGLSLSTRIILRIVGLGIRDLSTGIYTRYDVISNTHPSFASLDTTTLFV